MEELMANDTQKRNNKIMPGYTQRESIETYGYDCTIVAEKCVWFTFGIIWTNRAHTKTPKYFPI